MTEPIILPEAPWRKLPGLRLIVNALDGVSGATRLVGGCVRDVLAGMTVKDIDLATLLSPQDVIQRLEAAGIKAVPTGIAHGTVTAVSADCHVEITTLRRDVSTDGRRATISHTDDWQEDAARRDFTVNALYADPVSGAVFDYFGGMADLAAGTVRFIGDPAQRIAEDHLRILRFFRFYARFGQGAPDPDGLAACSARANDLMALSRERIADELLKILTLPDPHPVMALMIAAGILMPVLPEILDAMPLGQLVKREAECGFVGDPLRRLASLIPAEAATAEAIGARLKLSNAQRKRLISAARRSPEDTEDPRALAYWIGTEFAVDRLLIGGADLAGIDAWPPPVFPLTGGAIVARGVKAGPEVARLLKAAEQQWVAEGFPDKARAGAIADALCPSPT